MVDKKALASSKITDIVSAFTAVGYNCNQVQADPNHVTCAIDMEKKASVEVAHLPKQIYVETFSQAKPNSNGGFYLDYEKDNLEFQNPTFVFMNKDDNKFDGYQWKPRLNHQLEAEIRERTDKSVSVTMRVYDKKTHTRQADLF